MNRIKTVIAMFVSAMAVMLMSTMVFAYTGSGSENDPYIITDYKEFADLSEANISTSTIPKEKWYKLGSDIYANDDSNKGYVIMIGNETDFESYIHLDLAGYKMSRNALTTNPGMFRLNAGKLYIDDSVGTGCIEGNLRLTENPSSLDTGAIFSFMSNSYFYAKTELIINGGTFITPNDKYPCVRAYSSNGTIRINEGTFVNGAVETGVNAKYNGTTKTYIKGGTFSSLVLSDLGETIIYDCVTEKIWTSNSKLKNLIASNSTVTCDGTVVTNLDIQGKEGNIVITSPDKHYITYVGNGASGEMANERAYTGDTYTFPECGFTAPEGHYFTKWMCDGNYYSVGDSLTVSDNIIVIAQWEPRKYIVSFNTGGYYTESDQLVKYGENAAKPTVTCGYNGKYVKYWETSLGEKFDFGTKITQNTILYAYWTDINNKITNLTNGDTYTVYYGDDVKLLETISRGDTAVWSVTVNGKTILPETITSTTNSLCTIPAKAAAFVGKDVTVVFTITRTTTGGREFTTTTRIYLNYVFKQGDINGNGDIDSTDATLYLKHLSGNTAYQFDDEQFKRADVNYDGKYNMLDVIEILNS